MRWSPSTRYSMGRVPVIQANLGISRTVERDSSENWNMSWSHGSVPHQDQPGPNFVAYATKFGTHQSKVRSTRNSPNEEPSSYSPKNGNNLASSALSGRRPYSQISNASAYLIFPARSLPYHSSSFARKRSAID